ncbi:hypothetical protein L7F22_062428 [Adiantum nelumboides]|nr:hypothetical protein [Adiantum nelumboides]
MARLEAKVERLEAQLSAKERELAALTRMEQKAAAATKAQIEKLQQERDEFQRMAIGNQQVRTQQIHEMKKKEKDYMKLQITGMADRRDDVTEEVSSSQGRQTHEVGKSSRPPQTEDEIFRTHVVAAVTMFTQVMQNPRFMALLQPPPPSQPVGTQKQKSEPVKAQAQVIYTAESMETPVHLLETMQSPKPVHNALEQEKLNQVLMEKKKESKASMEILNLLQKEGRQRGTWNGKKADGDFYKMIVDAYEAKKQELMTENAELRAVLRTTQMEMRDFLNASNCASKNGVNGLSDTEPPPTPLGGRTDIFDLPFHMARDQIEQSLRVKMASIKERILELQDTQKSSDMACEASERELELEAQLVEARSIIQEQASIMSKHAMKKDNSRGVVGHLGVEREGVLSSAEENRAVLQERTKELAAERSALRKMAMELDKERSEMDKAKLKYEEEQASWESTLKSWAPGRVNGVSSKSPNDLRQGAQVL